MKEAIISSMPNNETLCRRLSAFGIRRGGRVKIIMKINGGIVISYGVSEISLCGDFDGLQLTEIP